MKKILSIILTFFLILTAIPFGAITVGANLVVKPGDKWDDSSGTGWGDVPSVNPTVTWTLDGTVLTISGNYNLDSCYVEDNPPWAEYSDSITEIIIENGVKNIPYQFFTDYPNIITASIRERKQSIKEMSILSFSERKTVLITTGMESASAGK